MTWGKAFYWRYTYVQQVTSTSFYSLGKIMRKITTKHKSKGVYFVALIYTELSCLPNHSRYTFHIPISRTASQFSKVNHNWCSTVQSRMFCYTLTVERMRYRNQPSKKCQTLCATCSKQQMQGTMQICEALLGCRSCLHCKHVMLHSLCWGWTIHITCRGHDILY